jgi:hypothetical protein
MRFLQRSEVAERFAGKRVAIVGSGPGSLQNARGFVDGHEIVVRVNNYKIGSAQGRRCDVHYSFYGKSIRKRRTELKRDGVKLCMCKCPNAHAVESEWHRSRGQMIGVDYRPHYERRKDFWFCDTYIPTVDEFLVSFNILDRHIPTTGFAAIIDILSFGPRDVYLTGFDFFRSRIHNVDEPWRAGRNPDDPIGHVPERELAWLAANMSHFPISTDQMLAGHLASAAIAA